MSALSKQSHLLGSPAKGIHLTSESGNVIEVGVFLLQKLRFLGRLWTDLAKILGTYDLRSSLKYKKFLLIWSTES